MSATSPHSCNSRITPSPAAREYIPKAVQAVPDGTNESFVGGGARRLVPRLCALVVLPTRDLAQQVLSHTPTLPPGPLDFSRGLVPRSRRCCQRCGPVVPRCSQRSHVISGGCSRGPLRGTKRLVPRCCRCFRRSRGWRQVWACGLRSWRVAPRCPKRRRPRWARDCCGLLLISSWPLLAASWLIWLEHVASIFSTSATL